MKRSERAAQGRRELDRKFQAADLRSLRARPHTGWIRAVRTALGMSQDSLAERLRTTQASVAHLERSERNETISIGKLSDVAQALDCTLVYALVPNDSLEATVQRQARRLAAETMSYVASTMALEDQSTTPEHQRELLDREARRLIDANRLWRAV